MSKKIVGADEVGYGSCAGPLMVCGVRADEAWSYFGLNDSKVLNAKTREVIYNDLLSLSIQYILVSRSSSEIDLRGLGVCLRECYQEVFNWAQPEDSIIVDGNLKYQDTRVKAVVKADSKYPTVMAASIIAKHTRDTLMIQLDQQHPNYSWKDNKGYITKKHVADIKEFGYTDLHRKSYKIKGINC